jgi:D-alanine--poly(phosphoribitol) ligase subunit 2
MTQTQTWLLGWFRDHKGVAAPQEADPLGVNYFQAGLVDSFGVMELVGDVEQRFGIRFTADHFQDRRFVTVGGLAEMIDELRSPGGKHG